MKRAPVIHESIPTGDLHKAHYETFNMDEQLLGFTLLSEEQISNTYAKVNLYTHMTYQAEKRENY